jgi:hypothetical protein
VRHNNAPLFTDFAFARLQDAETISPIETDFGDLSSFVAEEVRNAGLAVADARSDIYALCASLLTLFEAEDPLVGKIRAILQLGCSSDPTQRPGLSDLTKMLAAVGDGRSTDAEAPPPLPAADYWDEDTIVQFQNSRFKILDRLGKGGVGQTFKVVELNVHSDEKFGTYVAKLVRDEQDGEMAIRAYKQVRAYTTHPNLSTISSFCSATPVMVRPPSSNIWPSALACMTFTRPGASGKPGFRAGNGSWSISMAPRLGKAAMPIRCWTTCFVRSTERISPVTASISSPSTMESCWSGSNRNLRIPG